jgi:chromosome partitioning protein
MIISFLNQKGGVGKTMLATHLAMGLATRKGLSVLYVDADPQATAIDWRANRRDPLPFEVVGMPKPVLHESVPKFLEKGYQVCIIDGPGKLADVPRSAIMASHIVLVPVQPSPYDVWSSSDIVEEFRRAKIYKPDIRAAFVINRRISNTVVGRDVTDALAQYELPILKTHVFQRVCYVETAATGQTVLDAKETEATRQAAKEIDCLVDEVMEFAHAG